MSRARDALRRFRRPQIGASVHDNVGYNRELWDRYAARWASPRFRRDTAAAGVDNEQIRVLGDEWSPGEGATVREIVDDWIVPHLGPEARVAEIGVGGGRIALHVVDRVGELTCFDISEGMIERARAALGPRDNVRFVLLQAPKLPDELGGSLDFVYSFDVFVHLDLHVMWQYIQEIDRVLRPGGRAFLHTSNLTAPGGWARFVAQDRYAVEDHYFVTPETVRTLIGHTSLTVERESTPSPDNSVLGRDYLLVVRRPE
jgi:SAM-dependent methyltransferase